MSSFIWWLGGGGAEPDTSIRCTLRIDMALGGSYRRKVYDLDPTAWWRFADQTGRTIAKDTSGNAHHGTIAGGVTLGEDPLITEGGRAFRFTGAAGRVTFSSIAALTSTLTIEAVIKPDSPTAAGTILSNTDGTIRLGLNASRVPDLIYSGASHVASSALSNGVTSHLLVRISAGSGTFYINGVASGTFSAFPSGWIPTRIGAYANGTEPLKAWLDELVLYGGQALSATDAAEHYLAGLWTDVTDDIIAPAGLSLRYGIDGNGPVDRTPGPGALRFHLRNDVGNSGQTLGYYSPLHTDCRSGFGIGTLTRAVFTYAGTERSRFMGKVERIVPTPGKGLARNVVVDVADLATDLLDADLRNVTLQIDKTEDDLLETLFDALPIAAQPLALQLDEGLDTIPWAFHDLGAGARALAPASSLIVSTLGFLHYGPTAIARYENRQQRQILESEFSIDDTMVSLSVPTSLDGVYTHVRAVAHPKKPDPVGAATVLWSQQTDVAPAIGPGETQEFFGTYYNPDDPQMSIGGTGQITPEATTDYTFNAVADGSGVDKTLNVTVTAEFFTSTVKWSITNNDAATVYRTKLQCRGRALYDLAAETVESAGSQPYERAITIDMPYQSDIEKARGLADYVRTQYQSLTNQVDSVSFIANRSDAHMVAALECGIGERISLKETVTGLIADVFINSIRLDVTHDMLVRCTFGVAPTSFFDDVWIMDDPELSLADSTTIFGFA